MFRHVVPVHPTCPRCGSAATTRRIRNRPDDGGSAAYWACAAWPACPWSSWRPRYPEDCPHCRGVRYWADSRKSYACPACVLRWRAADGKPLPFRGKPRGQHVTRVR